MVQQASRSVVGNEQQVKTCQHYWIIEAPTGPVSRGVCQICEEIREFKNYIEAAPWGDAAPMSQSSDPYPAASPSENLEDSDEFTY